MAWVKLANSTTADADDVHGNFKEIRSGSLLPMLLSTTASTTDGAYDIGSATKRWKSGFFSGTLTAESANIAGVPVLVFATTTANTLTNIDITGLNGDNVYEYILKINSVMDGGTNVIRGYGVQFSGDSSASYLTNLQYGALNFQGGFDRFYLCYFTATSGSVNIVLEMKIFPNSGKDRTAIGQTGVGLDNDYTGVWTGSFSWQNTASTITSIKIFPTNTTTTQHIQLYAVRK